MKQPEDIQESIRQREDLTDFVENGVVSLHWVAADGTILWANQAELDLLGYIREEYIGSSITDFHADQNIITDILKRLAAGEKLSNYEARLRCKDGSIKHVLISSNVQFKDGQFVHTRCFTIDVTEQKKAERRTVLLYELTAALSKAVTVQQVGKVIVEQVIVKSGARAGLVTLLNQEGNQLEILDVDGYQEFEIKDWRSFSVDSPIPLAESVRSQQPLWLRSIETFQTRFPSLTLQPERHQAWAVIPLVVENRAIGALGLGFATAQRFDEDERRFMIALSQQSAQALERTRLSEMSRDLAILEVQQQLARDLHDAVTQTLYSANIIIQSFQRQWMHNQEEIPLFLATLAQLIQGASAEMRTLLLELHPDNLQKTPLATLLRQLTTAAQARKPMKVNIEFEGEPTLLPAAVHTTIYRIAQEAVNNIVNHAQATQLWISGQGGEGFIELHIRDNGQGFATDVPSSGLGLQIMRERAVEINAQFEIHSGLEKGTEIVVVWPNQDAP